MQFKTEDHAVNTVLKLREQALPAYLGDNGDTVEFRYPDGRVAATIDMPEPDMTMTLDDAVASSVATIGEAIKAVMNATAQTRERVALSNLLRFNAQHNERIRGGAR